MGSVLTPVRSTDHWPVSSSDKTRQKVGGVNLTSSRSSSSGEISRAPPPPPPSSASRPRRRAGLSSADHRCSGHPDPSVPSARWQLLRSAIRFSGDRSGLDILGVLAGDEPTVNSRPAIGFIHGSWRGNSWVDVDDADKRRTINAKYLTRSGATDSPGPPCLDEENFSAP